MVKMLSSLKTVRPFSIGRFLAASLILAAAAVSTPVCRAQNYGPLPPPVTLIPKTTWMGQNNQFATTTLEDWTGWWWGTDNDGLWHYSPEAKPGAHWQHFRAQDGLYDDSITSLCTDRKGRLWVGTERHGVSVYNNIWWQNYNAMTGPLGVHISSITLNPKNGDIWITSEEGIAIYSDTSKTWRYITEANGLGTNDINCVAFLSNGEAIVGSADDGLFIAASATNYTKWVHTAAALAAPASETGPGLSSNQVNCLLVNKAGKIYCGTSSGLSFSSDSGKTWSYLHGWMWQVKIKRAVRNTVQVSDTGTVLPLEDDYISALAYDKNGFIYIGHNHGGLEVIDNSDGAQQYHTKLNVYGTNIKSLTLLARGGLLIANYGDGPSIINWTNAKALPETPLVQVHNSLDFPVNALPMSGADLTGIAAKLKTLKSARKTALPIPKSASTPPNPKTGYFLGEDWQTQGNWMGRYGSEYAILCGADDANQDYVLGDQKLCSVTGSIGIPLNGGNSPSHWLQWEESGDPRVLFDPEFHIRRESEWDDQGDQDERMLEGPDIWLTVQVPAGTHRVSLYFMNKDGHTGVTRLRDFIVQLLPAEDGVDYHQTYDTPGILPILAEMRVENFWPGAFENFVVDGPGTYYFKIDRNHSLNTIIEGVFIDRLDSSGTAPSWMNSFSLANPQPAHPARLSPLAAKAVDVWSQLDYLYAIPLSAQFQREYRIQLLRAAASANAPKYLLDNWRLKLGLWNDTDWARFNIALSKMAPLSTTVSKK